jgi:hypothetical protein
LGRDGIDVDTLTRQESPRVLDVVNTRWFHRNVFETGRGQFGAILVFLKRSADATNP